MIRYREYGETHWERLVTRRGKLLLPTPRVRFHPTDDEVVRAILTVPIHFAGDIKRKRGTAVALTVTNLQALASSATFQSGWSSAWVDDTTTVALDYEVSGQLTSGTTPTAGSARVYTYSIHADGTTSPDLFSAGTEGTEGAATLHDSEQLDASIVMLWSTSIDTTTNDVYTMPSRSIEQAFGNVPLKWALYGAHDTVAALKATSGSAFYYTPHIQQFT